MLFHRRDELFAGTFAFFVNFFGLAARYSKVYSADRKCKQAYACNKIVAAKTIITLCQDNEISSSLYTGVGQDRPSGLTA